MFFFYTILAFNQSHSGPLSDIDGNFQNFQLTPGNYKSDSPGKVTGVDKIPLKADCIHGPIVRGIREPILYSFALDRPPRQKIYKEPRIKLLRDKQFCSITYNVLSRGR